MSGKELVQETAWLGRRGVLVQSDDLASAWNDAETFAKTRGKRVIENEQPGVLRREALLHYFFPYDPAERA